MHLNMPWAFPFVLLTVLLPAAAGGGQLFGSCDALSVEILSPYPGSVLTEPTFSLKLAISVLHADILIGARVTVIFNDASYHLDSLLAVEQVVLEVKPGSPRGNTHDLRVEVYGDHNGAALLCAVSAQYTDALLDPDPVNISIAISTNNRYAVRYFKDLIGSVLPTAVTIFCSLEEEIKSAMSHTELLRHIDILIVGPLDAFDFATGSQWLSGQVLIDQLTRMLSPRSVWVINGEGVGLRPLTLASIDADTSNNGGRVQAVFSTVSSEEHRPQYSLTRQGSLPPLFVYLPTAAGSLSEISTHSIKNFSSLSFLLSTASRDINRGATKRDIAYLYSNCIENRETFFSKLKIAITQYNISSTVDALGVCQGSGVDKDESRRSNRSSSTYVEDAIAVYSNYRFVLAFENAAMEGYITEKLTNAYLAGAVPIYLGAPDVYRYFSEGSMINCGNITTDECILRILDVYRNITIFDRIINTPPMNLAQWSLFFEALPFTEYPCDNNDESDCVNNFDISNRIEFQASLTSLLSMTLQKHLL